MPDNKIRFNDLEYGTAKISHIKARLNDKKWEPLFKFYTENYTEVERNRKELVLYSKYNFDMGVEDTNNNNELDDEEIVAFKNAYSQFKDLTLEDFKTFYETFVEVSKEDLAKEEAESIAATKAKFKNLPANVLKRVNENSKVKKTNNGYLIENTEVSDTGIKKQVTKNQILVNNNGELLAILNSEVEEIGKGKGRENLYYDPSDPKDYSYEGLGYFASDMIYDTGVLEHSDYRAKKGYIQAGKAKIEYNIDETSDNHPTKLVVNIDSASETSFNIEYDGNGKIKDIKLDKSNKKEPSTPNIEVGYIQLNYEDAKLENRTKMKIINMLNDGKQFGFDFTLSAENGEVEIKPIVVNKTNQGFVDVPQNVADDYFKMIEDGAAQGIDFQLEYNNNGFKVNYLTQTGAEGADFKRVEYSKNGKTKTTTTYDNNDVIQKVEQNGRLVKEIKSSRNDAFIEALLVKDYEKIKEIMGYTINPDSDFDFYAACKKYQDITGKNVMETLIKDYEQGVTDFKPSQMFFDGAEYDNNGNLIDVDFEPTKAKQQYINLFNAKMNEYNAIKKFEIEDPKVKESIMEVSRTQISENEYKETVGNRTYTVKVEDKKITVSNGDKKYTINLKGQPVILRRILTEQNSMILFQIAKKGIKLNWYDSKNPKPIDNEIEIRTLGAVYIASYDAGKNEMNMEAENVSTKLISSSIAHETGHSFWNHTEYSMNEEFKQISEEEYTAWENSDEPLKYGAHAYCCISLDELFAECYSLVLTGHAQSEYTIAKYFPRTLAVVRKMIEANN